VIRREGEEDEDEVDCKTGKRREISRWWPRHCRRFSLVKKDRGDLRLYRTATCSPA
jgi:hypothetical protein